MRFYLESLGCPKNLVDAHSMARLLQQLGHREVSDPRRADVLIVNTCGFVEDARAESLSELQKLAGRKRPGQKLIAAGCLAQYWGQAVAQDVPGVDALLGTRRWSEIGALLAEVSGDQAHHLGGRPARLGDPLRGDAGEGQGIARQGASAYVKLADGCSAPCAFCAIPLIKGPAASRPAAEIAADVARLVGDGVKEIVLIAQDTTAFGRDRGEPDGLVGLLRTILRANDDLRWLRLMYAYPGHVSPALIEQMASDRRVCHYLDLPLQHAHPAVLRRMKRPADVSRTRQLISDLRAAMPDLALRSTFIVGYPGESEAEFQALLDFVAEVQPDRMGAFLYSPEERTAAADLPNRVAEEVQAERYERLMALQQRISLGRNRAQVGRRLEVLVEGQGDGLCVGRTYRDAPEIDGLAFFPGLASAGEMVTVRVTQALEYDLVGERYAEP